MKLSIKDWCLVLNKSERWRANFKVARFQSIPALVYRNLPEAKKDIGGYLMDYYSTPATSHAQRWHSALCRWGKP